MVEGKEKKHEPTKQEKIVQTEKTSTVSTAAIPKRDIDWTPKTRLGKAVLEGKITSMGEIFDQGLKISESKIVDYLLPDLKSEIILIGGSSGKGGGIRRTPSRRTSRMHKSGRRFRTSVMAVVGNSDGYVGMALAHGPTGKHRDVVNKAMTKAKLNIIPVRRGCGSWECGCGGPHSVPFSVVGKAGSVRVNLISAPKGIGLSVSNEIKKMMRLAGIQDIWCKTRGQSQSRINFVKAVFNALKNIDATRIQERFGKNVGLVTGKVK